MLRLVEGLENVNVNAHLSYCNEHTPTAPKPRRVGHDHDGKCVFMSVYSNSWRLGGSVSSLLAGLLCCRS